MAKSLRISFSTWPLVCLKSVLFHPLQELSVQLFAQLEKDTKGTEEEADGNGWYRFACVHKVCFRNLASVQRYMEFLKEAKGVQIKGDWGEKGSSFFVPGLAQILLFRPRSFPFNPRPEASHPGTF